MDDHRRTGPTGPTSDEGKRVSRGNALKHGLAGAGVVLTDEEAEEVARRTGEWNDVFRPTNRVEAFHVAEYALESVRVQRCQMQERALRREAARRAESPEEWEEDRRLDAERVGARLGKDAPRVVRELRQSAQGCDWLLERWRGLVGVLEAGRTWDDGETVHALDLLGFPAELRNGPTPLDGGADHAALARGRIAELTRLREEVLDERDGCERLGVLAGLDPRSGELARQLRLVRRYESACQRRLQAAQRLLLGNRLVAGREQAAAASSPSAAVPAPDPAPPAPAPARPTAAAPASPPPPRPTTAPVPEPAFSPTPAPAPVPPAPVPPKGNRRWRKEQERKARRDAA